MGKVSGPAYEFSDAEKRDLTRLINEGKPLPSKYRFLLFEDRPDMELLWEGKNRDISNAVLPFQTLEHIDEPRREAADDEELALDMRGRQVKGWTNKLIWGDNKLILSSLRSGALRRQIEDAGGIRLVYIDPPFDVGADFTMDIEVGDESFHKERNILEEIAYRDTWGRSSDSFIAMIYERLLLMRDLIAGNGCIALHCDWRMSHLVRVVLDEVFGRSRFLNNVVWVYGESARGAKAIASHFPRNHDDIFIYRVGEDWTFEGDIVRRVFSTDEAQKAGFRKDENNRWFKTAPRGDYTDESIARLEKEGRVHRTRTGGIRIKYFLPEEGGKVIEEVPVGDAWMDIADAMHMPDEEQTGYATQKPEALVRRVIKAFSNPGDLVADFFCGAGTTAAVAERLGRKWIAADLGKFAIHTTRKRLIQVQRSQKKEGNAFRAFEVLNLGRYERQAYLNVSERLTARQRAQALARREAEFRDLILRAYRAEPLRNEGFFHGRMTDRLVVVGPINLPVGRLFVEEVVTECRKRRASRVDVLAFEFEMGLFPAALDEAKQKGIDVAPKVIPPEVFDKRAVERGQVRFHDVSYIEATPRYDKKEKLRVSIELTDFSVYYTQGLVDSVTADLKEGKSEVVCETGKLIKVSKDKKGVVVREVLTKHWTDWVDYWAIDFDYQSRKEIVKVPKTMGVEGELPGAVVAGEEFLEFEDRWTGSYIFENEWQSFRTRKERKLELTSMAHTYSKAGRYVVAVKVIDIFGNDTMTLVPVNI